MAGRLPDGTQLVWPLDDTGAPVTVTDGAVRTRCAGPLGGGAADRRGRRPGAAGRPRPSRGRRASRTGGAVVGAGRWCRRLPGAALAGVGRWLRADRHDRRRALRGHDASGTAPPPTTWSRALDAVGNVSGRSPETRGTAPGDHHGRAPRRAARTSRRPSPRSIPDRASRWPSSLADDRARRRRGGLVVAGRFRAGRLGPRPLTAGPGRRPCSATARALWDGQRSGPKSAGPLCRGAARRRAMRVSTWVVAPDAALPDGPAGHGHPAAARARGAGADRCRRRPREHHAGRRSTPPTSIDTSSCGRRRGSTDFAAHRHHQQAAVHGHDRDRGRELRLRGRGRGHRASTGPRCRRSLSVDAKKRIVQVTFQVTVPADTPPTDTLYIAGDFQGWAPGQTPMTRVDASTWTITLPFEDGTSIQYKYTRGSWDAVEKDAGCGEIPNRTLTADFGDVAGAGRRGYRSPSGGTSTDAADDAPVRTGTQGRSTGRDRHTRAGRATRSSTRSSPTGSRPATRVPKPGPMEPWDAPPTVHGYKGGDLLGIAEHLDELADLGITALYLTPVFASASNHRYHTDDYYSVDPLLGGNDALRRAARPGARPRACGSCWTACSTTAVAASGAFHHVAEAGAASPFRRLVPPRRGAARARAGHWSSIPGRDAGGGDPRPGHRRVWVPARHRGASWASRAGGACRRCPS